MYKWTDRWGSIHFTDDVRSIPKGATVKKLGSGGGHVSTVANPHQNLKQLKVEVPYSMIGNSMIIKTSVNGVPMRMILDTGASLVMIPPAVAKRAGIQTEKVKQTKLITANGKTSAPQVFIDELKTGSVSERSVKALVKTILKEAPDLGLLGMSYLERFKFHIDQDREVLLLEKR